MSETKPPTSASYFRPVADLVLVLVAVSCLGWFLARREPSRTPQLAAPPKPAKVADVANAKPEPEADEPQPQMLTLPPPPLDVEAVARAEAALDAASRDRARADGRLADATRQLELAQAEAAKEALAARTLSSRLRDPRIAIARAQSRGQAVRVARDKAKAERDGLAAAPRPKRKQLIDKSPVARPSDGDEYHFEVRRGRVAYIDMERLIEKVKVDLRLQLRLADGVRAISATVGPVGSFKVHYEVGRTMPESLREAIDSRQGGYGFRSWEIVPVRDLRGETFESIQHPASDFARAINRLTPSKSTITLWVYPDGFPMYRKLRDLLHARGFIVAARPLPEGVAIRGSPNGSVSAAQ